MNAPRPFTRKSAPCGLLDVELWPQISTDGMTDAERQRIEHWHSVMSAYVSGANVSAQLTEFKFSRKQMLRIFNRCIQVDFDGRLMGWRGLLPNRARKAYVRSEPITTEGGASGALQQLFRRVPDIKDYLVALILKQPIAEHIHEAHISSKDVHKAFLDRCRGAGVKENEWPFNKRWRGRRTIDVFIRDVVATHDRWGVTARYGDVAGSKMLTGTGRDQMLLALAPLDIAEMDAHRMDLVGVVGLQTAKGKAWIPIERIQLLLICEAAGTTILGYFVVIRRECNGEDILSAAVHLVKPWKRRTLLAGMEYPSGGGLPSGAIEGLPPFGVCALMVDNALINYSWAVIDRLMGRLGSAVNFGPVRKWMRRALVERIFGALESAGFQRVVSTVGSNPMDPRRKEPIKAAVKHRVELENILDLIDIEVAGYNAQTSEGCFGLERLDTLRQIVDPRNGRTLFPILPPTSALSPPTACACGTARPCWS